MAFGTLLFVHRMTIVALQESKTSFATPSCFRPKFKACFGHRRTLPQDQPSVVQELEGTALRGYSHAFVRPSHANLESMQDQWFRRRNLHLMMLQGMMAHRMRRSQKKVDLVQI
jgi:hypothetical protein